MDFRFAIGTRGMHFRSAPRVFSSSPASPVREDRMTKQQGIQVNGRVTEVLPDQNFRVVLDNGHTVLAYASGKMSKYRIRVLVGDIVTLELSPYDLTRGRITFRHKAGDAPRPRGG